MLMVQQRHYNWYGSNSRREDVDESIECRMNSGITILFMYAILGNYGMLNLIKTGDFVATAKAPI